MFGKNGWKMSHIGKKPINIPDGVEINVGDLGLVEVKGKLGELSCTFSPDMLIKKESNVLTVNIPSETKKMRELHGLTRALIANMVEGVSNGYSKELNLVGVGYTADSTKGNFLLLNLGYSHPIKFSLPDGISASVDANTKITLESSDKQLLGQVSADIQKFRPPEPYKGKGVLFEGQKLKRKAGKSGKV